MADIQKDSYNEANNFTKVIAQVGQEIQDYEFNELQDNIRIAAARGLAAVSNDGNRTAVSADDGFLCLSTGLNQVTFKAGNVVLGGVHYKLANDLVQTMATNPSNSLPRMILAYLTVVESEVADPNLNSDLGETTRRKKLQVTVNYAYGTPNSTPVTPALPADTVQDIWAGGARYYAVAEIAQFGAVVSIPVQCLDRRSVMSPRIISQITRNLAFDSGQTLKKIEGSWLVTAGDGISTFGDFNGSDAVEKALEWIWYKTNKSSGERYSFRLHVKAGEYTFRNWRGTAAASPNQGPITRHWDVHITGDGGTPRSSVGESFGVNGTRLIIEAGTSAVLGGPGSERTNFRLENLSFNCTVPAIRLTATLDLRGARSVHCAGVNFDGVEVLMETRGNRFKFDACSFVKAEESASSGALVTVNMAGGRLNTLVFDSCMVRTLDTATPANFIRVMPQATGISRLGLLKLRNCDVNLVGATQSANEGSHSTQRGVFRVGSTGTTVDCKVEDIVLEDCIVTSDTSASTTAYGTGLVEWHSSGGVEGTDSEDNQVQWGKFVIRGGAYNLTVGQGQKFPAFRIQGFDAFQSNKAGSIILKDFVLNVSLNGSQARYCNVSDQGDSNTSASYNGGLFFLAGKTVTIRDVEVNGYVIQSSSGDIAIRASKAVLIDGLYMGGQRLEDNANLLGGGNLPSTRINLNSAEFCESVVVRNLTITGDRKISLENDNGAWIQLPNNGQKCVVDTVVARNVPLNGSPFFLWLPSSVMNMTVRDCEITGETGSYGKSFRFRINGTIGKLTIADNKFQFAWGDLVLEEAGRARGFSIRNNSFTIGNSTSDPNAAACLRIYQRFDSTNGNQSVSVVDNQFHTGFGKTAVVWGENAYDNNIGFFMGNTGTYEPGPLESPSLAKILIRPGSSRIRGLELAGALALNASPVVQPAAGSYALAFNHMTLIKE